MKLQIELQKNSYGMTVITVSILGIDKELLVQRHEMFDAVDARGVLEEIAEEKMQLLSEAIMELAGEVLPDE